ncbi:MAG: hypothetical protein GY810_31385 [Aureispira sp.]|nr:hypothetical protein [Aureispira sp.]
MTTQFKRIFLLTLLVGMGIGLVNAFFNSPQLYSNDPFLKTLKAQLEAYQNHYQPDKVYLHLDKKFYKPGEDIWFSAYVRDAQTFQESKRSGIVYIELLDPRGSAVQKLTLIATQGKANGEFKLDENANGGLYKVRAYTKWQQNNNSAFEQDLQVQKVVLPNLNMQLNFDRKSYSSTDKVSATLDLNTLENKPLAHHTFDFVVSLDGQELKRGNSKTGAEGRTKIEFQLPNSLSSNDGLLNVLFSYKGQTESISRSIPIALGNIDLVFYPEGGELIEGMICGVGFKALDEFGKPADVEGNIMDVNDKIVATFKSYHQGMGQFDLAPQNGQKYFAQITKPANIKKTYTLPSTLQKGYSLKVRKQTDADVMLDVVSTENEKLYLVAQSRNKIHYSKVIEAKAGITPIHIPTKTFPIGIVQLTLFDSKQIARAERLVFTNKHKQLKITVSTDKEKYLPREKVDMSIQVTDEKGIPMPSNFSLAVVDDKLLTFADDKQGHILSYMLLESDIQGKIEEPNFYFDQDTDPKRLKPEINRRKSLDNLLMTQGWRKFAWKEVKNQKFASFQHNNELALISGEVFDQNGDPIKDAKVSLDGLDKFVKTDANGFFIFNDVELHQTTGLNVEANNMFTIKHNLLDYSQNLNFTLYKSRKVAGTVNANGSQYRDVLVTIPGTDIYTYTDNKGKYSLNFPEQYTQLQFSHYDTESKTIDLKKGQTQANVKLSINRPKPVVSTKTTIARNPRAGNFSNKRKGGKGNVEILRKKAELERREAEAAQKKAQEHRKEAERGKKQAQQNKKKEKAEKKAADGKKDVADKIEEHDEPIMVDADPVAEAEPVPADPEEIIEANAQGVDAFDDEIFDRRIPIKKNVPTIQATRYYRAREFAAPSYENSKVPEVRTDFRSTIYWNPNVETDNNGRATLSFYNSDDITQFRVSIEGFDATGGIGRVDQKYFTQLPFEMVTKVPTEVLTGDKVNIPLTLTNNTNDLVEGTLTISPPSHLKLLKTPPSQLELKAGASTTIFLECEVANAITTGEFSIAFEAEGLSDRFVSHVDARPRGFPVQEVFSGDQMNQQFTINLQHPLEGSVVAKLEAYPNTLDEVMNGMEDMLRMPGGCFEQTSSSNYPNLLVLNYLQETNTSNPAIEDKVKGFLDVGYKRLVGYESPSGGFDWWGRDPAHEALSAYGLMEFVDMSAVYPVDQELIKRTADWLLSRRDDKGSWTKNPHALHSWANAEVTDAYIVWALCEAGYSSKIKKELDKSYTDAVKSEDPYMMSLLANALFKLKDDRANVLLKEIIKTQQKDGSFVGLTSSVTNSTGHSLKIETTSLAALAIMQSGKYKKELQQVIKTIKGGKTYYGYGSTQGTVLALKALLQHAKDSKRPAESGNLLVMVNGKTIQTIAYTPEQKEIAIPNLAQYLKKGKQKVEVKFEDTKTALPFDIELTYTTRMPQNSPDCKLSLNTTLPKAKVNMGETVRLTTTLKNITDQGQPMTMAMVGVPAGLSLQPWQLKEMQEKKVFDYYELFDGYVVFHYEQMKPNETKTINLDLKADIPGQYEAPASSAFLYYTNEHKVWSMPESMTIN